MTLRIAALYRYPVKGLGAERIAAVELAPGAGVPGDRRFAFARDDAGSDPHPSSGWRPKSALLALHNAPALAAIDCRMDSDGRLVLRAPDRPAVTGDPRHPEERHALESFIRDFSGSAAPNPPRLLNAVGCAFTDAREPSVSLVSLASIAELERAVGIDLDVRRFRANLVIEGGLPWQEFDWCGADIVCGNVRLRVLEPIPRCAAILAEPGTGRTATDLLRPLARRHGEAIFGVLARVTAGGRIARGDPVAAPPGGRFTERGELGLL